MVAEVQQRPPAVTGGREHRRLARDVGLRIASVSSSLRISVGERELRLIAVVVEMFIPPPRVRNLLAVRVPNGRVVGSGGSRYVREQIRHCCRLTCPR